MMTEERMSQQGSEFLTWLSSQQLEYVHQAMKARVLHDVEARQGYRTHLAGELFEAPPGELLRFIPIPEPVDATGMDSPEAWA